jgi:molybdopterin converting factor small subunit
VAHNFVTNEISCKHEIAAVGKVTVAVTFHIPGALREFTGGQSRVQIEASPATLAEALAALWAVYPGVRDRIANEQGQVRQHINIFVGNEDVRYTGGNMSRVPAGAEISIVPAVSGGATPAALLNL